MADTMTLEWGHREVELRNCFGETWFFKMYDKRIEVVYNKNLDGLWEALLFQNGGRRSRTGYTPQEALSELYDALLRDTKEMMRVLNQNC
jgi:hypothetical protein